MCVWLESSCNLWLPQCVRGPRCGDLHDKDVYFADSRCQTARTRSESYPPYSFIDDGLKHYPPQPELRVEMDFLAGAAAFAAGVSLVAGAGFVADAEFVGGAAPFVAAAV
jgi:uncharacterized protein (DUF1684 family)